MGYVKKETIFQIIGNGHSREIQILVTRALLLDSTLNNMELDQLGHWSVREVRLNSTLSYGIFTYEAGMMLGDRDAKEFTMYNAHFFVQSFEGKIRMRVIHGWYLVSVLVFCNYLLHKISCTIICSKINAKIPL